MTDSEYLRSIKVTNADPEFAARLEAIADRLAQAPAEPAIRMSQALQEVEEMIECALGQLVSHHTEKEIAETLRYASDLAKTGYTQPPLASGQEKAE